MIVLVGLLHLVGVLHQPLFATLLWPLIPNAVVGFWPEPQAAAAKPQKRGARG